VSPIIIRKEVADENTSTTEIRLPEIQVEGGKVY
jgi:hypothetical protein